MTMGDYENMRPEPMRFHQRRLYMKSHWYLATSLTLVLFFVFAAPGFSQEMRPIRLPKPQTSGGKPLMDVLRERHSSREYSTEKLSEQTLSNLLWAAHGLNRPVAAKGAPNHTNPSGHNVQEVDVYVATAEGLFVYDELANALKPVRGGDIRPLTGNAGQKFVADAPVNLIYVADLSKIKGEDSAMKQALPYATTLGIAENVYLYCASEGLATVVRLMFDKEILGKAMGLRADQMITLEQPVGYPKK
jgi:nitroreductase